MGFANCAHQRQGGDLSDGGGDTDAHAAKKRSGAIYGNLPNGVEPFEYLAGRSDNTRAEFRQYHAPSVAREQRRSKLCFDQPDLTAQRRLRDTQSLGRTADAAEFGDMNKRF